MYEGTLRTRTQHHFGGLAPEAVFIHDISLNVKPRVYILRVLQTLIVTCGTSIRAGEDTRKGLTNNRFRIFYGLVGCLLTRR